jgi:hypothetical protein
MVLVELGLTIVLVELELVIVLEVELELLALVLVPLDKLEALDKPRELELTVAATVSGFTVVVTVRALAHNTK